MFRCKYCTALISKDTLLMKEHLDICNGCPDHIKNSLKNKMDSQNDKFKRANHHINDESEDPKGSQGQNQSCKKRIKTENDHLKNFKAADFIPLSDNCDRQEQSYNATTTIEYEYFQNENAKKKNVIRVVPIKLKVNVEKKILNLIANSEQQFLNIDEKNETIFLHMIKGNFFDNLKKSLQKPPKLLKNHIIDLEILNDWAQRKQDILKSGNLWKSQINFPVSREKEEILNIISENQVVLISGEPDSGMSTQIVQYILDHEISMNKASLTSIACTQSRRLSALAISERVANERGEEVGISVGLLTHSETLPARPQGSIVFCTTGILLQLIRTDPSLQCFSHIVLDDLHERSMETDLILAILKSIISKRSNLKVILLTDSFECEYLSKYFNKCPIFIVPGGAFSVEEYFLEDVLSSTGFKNFQSNLHRLSNIRIKKSAKKFNKRYKKYEVEFEEMIRPYIQELETSQTYPRFVLEELHKFSTEKINFDLIVALIKFICDSKPPGSILIFLPEITDVLKLHEILEDTSFSSFSPERFRIHSLHSEITVEELKAIFNDSLPEIRKIIIATDIAETSVTIENITYVIDYGMKKQFKFEVESYLETMETEWVSEVNATRRKRQAGRSRPGICYRLYSKARAQTFERLSKPEILRFGLEKLILNMKILQIKDVKNFISSFLTTPNNEIIALAIDSLKQLNALDNAQNLTSLGYYLACLPLDPITGKMIIMAALFSCIDPIFSVAANLSLKNIFHCSNNDEEILNIKQKLTTHLSDHILVAEILKTFELQNSTDNILSFCKENFLSFKVLDLISKTKKLFAQYLFDLRFLKSKTYDDDFSNKNSNDLSLVKSILCSGLYPNIAVLSQSSKNIGKLKTRIAGDYNQSDISVTSVVQKTISISNPYLIFSEKKERMNVYTENNAVNTALFDVTVISPVAILLASPSSSFGEVLGNSVVNIEENLFFMCNLETARIVKKLQEQIHCLLKLKLIEPGMKKWDSYVKSVSSPMIEYLSENIEELSGISFGGAYHSWENITNDWRRITGTYNQREDADSQSDTSQRGDRHPPWLRGKAIGMYYANKSKGKKKEKNSKTMPIKLKPSTEAKIRDLIDTPSSSSARYLNAKETNSKDGDLEAKYDHITDSQFKRKFLRIISGNLADNLEKSMITSAKLLQDPVLDVQFLDELNQKKKSSQYMNVLKFRQKLPAFEKRLEILKLISDNQVVLISGETGCGKTTQVAQFILDNEIENKRGSITKIACTQPRRISAITVAERVANERADNLGNSVGYHIRLEKTEARNRGSIVFCTTGMLLQFMQMDPALRCYSHIIIDEIHERSLESDFIITLLKHIIPKRPDLKVILMSATLNSEQFSRYYNDCPAMEIPGFTYPVEELYLEDVIALTRFKFPMDQKDQKIWQKKRNAKKSQKKQDEFDEFIGPYLRHLKYTKKYPDFVLDELQKPESEKLNLDLIYELTKQICFNSGPGAILIFLPGVMDITKLHKMFLESNSFPSHRYKIFPLHSRMPTVDQKLIFEVPSKEIRKIVIATNIAETSITIEDVVYVIDAGKIKLKRFDVAENLQTLEPEWVSLANARQRKGRAGRVQPGVCYHLFTKVRAETFDQYPLPEMLRTRLEEVILQIKILQIGRSDTFLASVMNPPDPRVIELSLELLRQLNALDKSENLTPLGYHLARLPLDPRSGKMILWAAMFSCIDPVFAIAASLSFKDAFYCPMGKEDEARKKKLELGLGQYSDHIALAEALRLFEEKYKRGNAYAFCREYFLSWNTLKLLSDMKQQFTRYLYEMKFLNSTDPSDRFANRNSHNKSLIKAIVCAGLYPNIAIVKNAHAKGGTRAITIEKEKVKVHPASLNDKISALPSPYLTYYLKMKSTGIYLFDTTCVSPLAVLFASPSSSIGQQNGEHVINIANQLSFLCEPRTAQIIQKLHKELDSLLEFKVAHPGMIDFSQNDHEGNILSAIIELLSESDENLGLDSGRYHAWDDFDEDCVEFDDY